MVAGLTACGSGGGAPTRADIAVIIHPSSGFHADADNRTLSAFVTEVDTQIEQLLLGGSSFYITGEEIDPCTTLLVVPDAQTAEAYRSALTTWHGISHSDAGKEVVVRQSVQLSDFGAILDLRGLTLRSSAGPTYAGPSGEVATTGEATSAMVTLAKPGSATPLWKKIVDAEPYFPGKAPDQFNVFSGDFQKALDTDGLPAALHSAHICTQRG